MAMKQFASFYIGKNLFGIDVRLIREINRNVDIAHVYGAPEFVQGLLNLRGQIVTVIDIGMRMGLSANENGQSHRWCVVLKTSEELAVKRVDDATIDDTSRDLTGLLVDAIGDMVNFEDNEIEPPPANIGEIEGKFIGGVVKLDKDLLIIIKVNELLKIDEDRAGK
jgi:purine-binding chemotaxis protein CheW